MITARICFAAVAVVRDVETNAISAFNILEGIQPVGFPFFMQQMSFFVLWERAPEDPRQVEGDFTVNIAGHPLSTAHIQVDFQNSNRNRSMVNLSGLTIPQPGQLRFSVELTTGARADYFIEVTPPPAVGVQAPA